MRLRLRLVACILAGALQSGASAELVTLTVTNTGESSFAMTPLWVGFDNGSFDLFTPGAAASSSLEALAEGGDVSGLQNDFTMGTEGVVTAPGGAVNPVFEPGETSSLTLDINTLQDRFFNYASMIIPSNDSFIGSQAPIEVFDASGNVIGGTFTLNVGANQIWDAGTEVNDTFGAPFSTIGGTSTDENGVVALLPAGGLDNFLNTGTPIGNITDLIAPGEGFARITITSVPEPSGLAALSIASAGLVLRRRRR